MVPGPAMQPLLAMLWRDCVTATEMWVSLCSTLHCTTDVSCLICRAASAYYCSVSMLPQLSPCVFQSLVVSTSNGASMSSGLLLLCMERSCRREHATTEVQG